MLPSTYCVSTAGAELILAYPPSATARYTLYPTTGDVLESQFNATERVLACAPLPANGMVTGLKELLVMVISPLAVPAVVGVKFAFRLAVCPGAIVVPLASPVVVNSAPLIATLDTTTSVFPLLVSVATMELLFPSSTSPKLKSAKLETKSAVGAVAVPVAKMVQGEPGASLISETDPVALPAVLGEKTILKLVPCPAATFAGTVSPEMLKPAPVTVALEIVASAAPVLSTVIICELLVPWPTLGKLALPGVADSCAWGRFPGAGVPGFPAGRLADELEPVTKPAHPLSRVIANIARPRTDFVAGALRFPVLATYFVIADPGNSIVA